MSYDVTDLRRHFPALARGAAHFDGPGGTQVPDVVGAAVADALTDAIANRGRVTAAERRADDIVMRARADVAALVGGTCDGVVFGRSMTQLTYDLSRVLAKTWSPNDEIIVTSLDHDANHRPWVQAATAAGATVRVAHFDPETGELPAAAVTGLLGQRTRLVAVTAASNLIGTRPDIPAIARAVRSLGTAGSACSLDTAGLPGGRPLLYVDGVHATAHAAIDIAALGADVIVASPYKFLGPHCGVLVADPELLSGIHPDKLAPSSDAVPERFELGTLPYELLAGTSAAIRFLADLSDLPRDEDLRVRLPVAMARIERHEDALRVRIEAGLAALGATVWSRAQRRTPTLLVRLPGIPDEQVRDHLASRDINAPCGSFYALEASRRLGLGDTGAVRLGLAPYTDDSDVDRLLAALTEL
ncbi:MAG: cysteine desulfurase-like protein [Micrococcales bacterium]|nr:cysteine desulfurase-like protein [Micrococcales bacterium]